jgi:hypothetical protein
LPSRLPSEIPADLPLPRRRVKLARPGSVADLDGSVKTAHDMADRLRRRDGGPVVGGLSEPQTRHEREQAG